MKTTPLAIAASMAAGTVAHAQEAVQWRVEDGGNGHWYRCLPRTASELPWSLADAIANSLGGELATLTTLESITWVISHVASDLQYWDGDMGPWVGALQDPGAAEPDGGWVWSVSLTLVDPQLWHPSQPSNATSCGGNENRANFWPSPSSATLGDMVEGGRCSWHPHVVVSAVVEWSADCNGDGIVDYGQIRDGTFSDLNGNGVPDSCECIADLTGNGEVNGADISVLLGFWGKVPEPLPAADINQDGNVDGLDLAVLLGSWGPCK